MGYTREQRAANAKKKAEAENKNTQKTDTLANNTVQETTKIKSVSKKKLKLEDDVLISVKSNVYGQLIYINHKTGDETRWEEYGEPQSLSVADLRAMKAKQLDFFKENWITILGIDSADDEYDDVTVEEIYDALMISQYYKSDIPDDIGEIFNWSPDKIREILPKLTSSMKTSVIIRANELIENGTLDSISRVKAIEESLNCVLASPKDN